MVTEVSLAAAKGACAIFLYFVAILCITAACHTPSLDVQCLVVEFFHIHFLQHKYWPPFIHQFSVPQIEYPLGGSSKKCSHVSFLLQVCWVILLFCQIVLLFDINVFLMLPWWPVHHNSTIWCHNSSTIAIINRKYTWLHFLLLPPSGYSIWGTENY